MTSLLAPTIGAADGRAVRWLIVTITVAAHGALIAALMIPQSRPSGPIPPQVLTVSVAAAEAAAEAPAAANSAAERKPASKPKRTLPKPSAPARIDPAPAPAEAQAEESGAGAPTAAPASAPAASAGTGPAASLAGTAKAGPAPVSAPRFDADYLANPPPLYPSTSRSRGEQGKTLLNVLVSATGEAAEVRVRIGSGFDRLDQAALDAVRRWKFVPAHQGGEAVAAWVVVPILFHLRR